MAPWKPVLRPLAVRIGAARWTPRLLPQIVGVDRGLARLSRGRVTLLDVAGLPNLTLTVTGRKSGQPRSTPLLCAPDGDRYLIAGSYFGAPATPAWVANLRAAGHAEITIGGRDMPVLARELAGPERATAWARLLAVWPNFARYEQRTSRLIPVFELLPQT